MPGLLDTLRADGSTHRTRLYMVGAFVGALMLLVTSMTLSWPVAVGRTGSAEDVEAAAKLALDSPSGTCLSWRRSDAADMRRIDCAQPHRFEVTSNLDISHLYPAGASAPDMTTWQQIATERCVDGAKAYLGAELDPFGRYAVNALKPTDRQWTDGDRKLRCGLQSTAASGEVLDLTGTARGANQSNVHEPGICFALTGTVIGDPVDCAVAHAFEVVGNSDLTAVFPAEYPTEEAQGEKLVELCAAVAAEYTGGLDLASKQLTLFWDTLKAESWATGSRSVDCKVGAKVADGSALAAVTGSVKAVPVTPTSAPPESAPPASGQPSQPADPSAPPS